MCCGCRARPLKEENLVDGGVFRNRHCTDCPVILGFLVFTAGWVVILTLAALNGDPKRILKPSNARGELCGEGRLSTTPNLFIPVPSRIDYGICVAECPAAGGYVCNTDVENIIGTTGTVANTFYTHTEAEYTANRKAFDDCQSAGTGCSDANVRKYAVLLVKLAGFKCFPVLYDSKALLNRCLPTSLSDKAKQLLGSASEGLSGVIKIGSEQGVGSFFTRGFSELEQTWRVIAISCGTAIVVSVLWLVLMRFILAPIVYLSMLVTFCGLIGLGVLAYFRAKHLDESNLPGDDGTGSQVTVLRILAFVFVALGLAFLVAVLVLLKNIRISMVLIKESSKALVANVGMIAIPPIALLLLTATTAGFAVAMLYIQTIGEFKNVPATPRILDLAKVLTTSLPAELGGVDSAIETAYNQVPAGTAAAFNIRRYDTSKVIKAMHAYNFFGFLWVSNVCIMFCFFVMAMVIVCWYFSATSAQLQAGGKKHTRAGTLCQALWSAFRYHLGTILLGSLLIAIIQFIRAVVLYLERHYLSKWKTMNGVKVVMCCLNCCLKCIEYMIKVISKSAFVIVCIKNNSFCTSACEALALLVTNIVRTGILLMMSAATMFMLKLFIVASNIAIAYGLMQVRALTDGREVESMLFPLTAVGILSMIIASVFMSVFETCIDTVMICYFVDDKELEGRYLPLDLAKIVGKFKLVEEARQKYDQEVKEVRQ